MGTESAIQPLEGEFRSPTNGFQNLTGSIHNDAVASKLGFRGGTVPGSVHMDQFVPMLIEVYGSEWFKFGSISLHFTQPTVDLERVRAILHPGAERSHLRMCNEAGGEICMGTAAHDPQDAGSEFARRMANQQAAEPGRLRILEGYAVGDLNLDIPLKLSREDLDRTLKVITEPLPTYGRDGVLPPSQTVLLAHMTRPVALAKTGAAVGLFGALEVRHVQGPLKADHAYLGRTRMLKLTESPRTENAWYDVDILDAATGKVMATVGFMTRFLKASSPLWAADNGQ